MAPDPEWRNSSLVLIADASGPGPASPLTFSGITPGTPTAAQTVYLDNDLDGTAAADPIYRGSIHVLAKLSAGSQFLSDGLPVLDQRMIEIKVVQGRGGLAATATGWVRCGTDAFFTAIPLEIASTEGVELQVRMNVPAGDAQVADTDVSLTLRDDRSLGLATGFYPAGAQGVLDGIGDDSRPASFFEDVTLSPAGTPDNTVIFSDARWRDVDGVPHVELTHTDTITTADGDASAITGTEGYYITVSFGTGASATLTKGSKAAAIGSATKPAAPADEKLWGWIAVTLTGGVVVIESADITKDGSAYPETAAIVSTSSLDQTYSGIVGLSGGRLVRERINSTITHTDATTETVWQVPSSGTLEAAASAPEAMALALWEVTTSGGAITASVDRRSYLDHLDTVIHFHHNTAISGAVVVGTVAHPGNRPLYLRPTRGAIAVLLHDLDPSALGNSAGAWPFEIKIDGTSIFTGSGSDDRRPSIPYNATSNEAVAANGGGDILPEVVVWNPGELLEFSIPGAVPTGGSNAAGVSAAIRWR